MKRIIFTIFVLIFCVFTVTTLVSCGCEHEWKEATCTTPKTCSLCNEVEGTPNAHRWMDATCTTPRTCSTCGKTEGTAIGHSWRSATCTSPKMCSACSETEGTATGHSWKSATCTSPKVCTVCSKTEGNALGHRWSGKYCSTCSSKAQTYSKYSDVPEFGNVFNPLLKPDKTLSYENDTIYYYYISSINNAGGISANMLEEYFDLLEAFGFTCASSESDSALFMSSTITIFFSVQLDEKAITIFVVQ